MNLQKKALIVIPARMASSRFPNKPLAKICGVSMIERVWKIAQAVNQPVDVVIATDCEELRKFSEQFGAHVVMTSVDCPTGSDRVAEATEKLGNNYNAIFSLQGDAVLTPPWIVDSILKEMQRDPNVQIATPAVKLVGEGLKNFVQTKKMGSSSGTLVVFDNKKNALYFSKSLIPFERNDQNPNRILFRHIGLYGYTLNALKAFNKLPEGILEKSEQLEQLRALENGIPIRIVEVDYKGRTHGSVDRPEDVAIVEDIIHKEGELV